MVFAVRLFLFLKLYGVLRAERRDGGQFFHAERIKMLLRCLMQKDIGLVVSLKSLAVSGIAVLDIHIAGLGIGNDVLL